MSVAPVQSEAAPVVLFTAFEPSGDALAAPVVAELRRRRPEWRVVALGGPKMAAAGAELLETTTEQAAMGLGALAQVRVHRERLRKVEAWLRGPQAGNFRLLVPTDSPAANWSICKLVRRNRPRARIVHLVAPQLWAWAPWRIGRMKRLSDHVLCLLPFEPAWFESRGMPATFVGHPLYRGQESGIRSQGPGAGGQEAELPAGAVKLALLPGSRGSELRRNLGTELQVFGEVVRRHVGLVGVLAVRDEADAQRVRALLPGGELPVGLHLVAGRTDAVLDWADVVLTKSGTSTLQVAAHGKPMVVFYNLPRWQWHLGGRWLVGTRTFALPNLIGEAAGKGRIVPEFVPHFGDPAPLAAELERLLGDPAAAAAQRGALAEVAAAFAGVDFAKAAGERLLQELEARSR